MKVRYLNKLSVPLKLTLSAGRTSYITENCCFNNIKWNHLENTYLHVFVYLVPFIYVHLSFLNFYLSKLLPCHFFEQNSLILEYCFQRNSCSVIFFVIISCYIFPCKKYSISVFYFHTYSRSAPKCSFFILRF